MALALMVKAFKLNYSTPTNNQRISSNPRNKKIAQPGNLTGYNAVQNVTNQVVQNAVQNPRVQTIRNQNRLIGVPGNANQNLNGNGNLVAARAEDNAIGHNVNQIRCHNFRGVVDLDEIEEVNANCIVMANLQQASTSGTQTDRAPVYDSDGSAEVHNYENYYDNEIVNMFTQEEQYTELLEPIPKPLQVPQNDNNVISEVTSVEHSGEIVEQHPINVEETRALYDSLYQNLAIEVEKVNTVNRKLEETNAELTTELARFKNQEKYLSSGKQIMTLNEEISDLNKQLSKEKSTVFFLLEEKKKLKSDFKIRVDKLLDKQIQLEKKIKESDNILVKMGQSIQTIHMLSPKPDSFYHTEQKMALDYQNHFYLKQDQKKQQSLYDGKVLLEKNDPPVVHDSEETLQLAQEKFSDDTTPSVALKFLNEVKSTIVTLQRVVKHRMTIETHNSSSSAHQELYKIVKDEIFPIVNQVDARVKHFEIQFLKEAAKFIGDFKSLAKEADDSLAKHKALELEIERLLKAVVSQDIMSVVQNNYVVDTSNLQTELERMKECFENCIIKKETEYAKLWNDWFKKCEECKFNKILYDKAYNDMQRKIEWLQAQLGDLKGKSKDTSCVSDTLNPIHALSKPITLNLIPTPQESKVVKNDKVIALGMFRINPFKTYREEKHVPNIVRASARTKPITVSQPSVITKKDVNFDSNGLSSTGVDNTKTRSPQPRSNTKNDRVPSASKSSCNKNKEVEVKEYHRNLLLSKNKKHMSSECNNVKLATQNVKSKVVCAMCKQCLISVNHDVCLLNYVNGKTSCGKNQKANVSIIEKQKKQQPKVKKTKKLGFIERLATPKNSKTRSFLRWSPTGRLFDLKGKIITSSDSESQSDCLNGDNACTPNPLEPTIKWFPKSTFSLAGFGDLQWGNILITRVYFVEGLGHNLFSIGQFCDSDLKVAFRRNACFVRNLEGVDLLSRNRTTNLYTINLYDMASASLICLTARASSTKSWLWHQRLSDDNFETINDLAKHDLVSGLPKFKYHKEHLCPSCEQEKSKRASHPSKPVPNSRQRLHLLHMDLCGPMRIASINGKRNDGEDIGKLGAKGDIGFFIGYSADSCAFRVYNQITKNFMKTMNVSFNELSAMAFEQHSSKLELQSMTSRQISSGLDLTYAPSTITTQQPTEGELDLLFEAMYDDYIGGQPSAAQRTITAAQAQQDVNGLSLQQQQAQQQGTQASLQPEIVVDNVTNALFDANSFVNHFATSSTSAPESSSSQYVDPSNMHTFYQPYPYEFQWTKDHPLEQNGSYQDIFGICCTQIVHCVSNGRKTAFLHGSLKEDVYVCQPEGFIDVDHPSHVYILKKALYGLKQAPRAWRFDDDILVVQVYVDDIIFGSTHPRYTQLFSDLMKSRFEMSMMREMTFFFSLQVNQSPCGIFINQSNYVLEILKKYGIESCDPVGTSMEIKDQLDLDHNGTPVDVTKYRSMIGALMYLTSSGPDIVHATCLCARLEVKRIFRYLRGTIHTGLWYTKDFGFELTGFSDADYAGCKDTFNSTFGGTQFLGQKLVSWSSKKQDYATLSTAEAEYVSLSACCAQVLWMRTQLTDYGFHFKKIPIYCDSKSEIAISCNPTNYQLADIFTKALPPDRFNYLVCRLGMRSLSLLELDRLAKSQ
nr:hypothetical protein [Tanacetum cinerariifolium]